MAGDIFLLDHAFAHATDMRPCLFLIKFHYFIDKTAIFFKTEFGIVVDFDSYFAGGLEDL
jgi:hypothetical protein